MLTSFTIIDKKHIFKIFHPIMKQGEFRGAFRDMANFRQVFI